jgi:hypothetical protein
LRARLRTALKFFIQAAIVPLVRLAIFKWMFNLFLSGAALTAGIIAALLSFGIDLCAPSTGSRKVSVGEEAIRFASPEV